MRGHRPDPDASAIARVPIRSASTSAAELPHNDSTIEPTCPKTFRIDIRFSEDEHELCAEAALATGETLSDFFSRAAQGRAQEVLADQRALVVSDRVAIRFLDALDRTDERAVKKLEDLRRRV